VWGWRGGGEPMYTPSGGQKSRVALAKVGALSWGVQERGWGVGWGPLELWGEGVEVTGQ